MSAQEAPEALDEVSEEKPGRLPNRISFVSDGTREGSAVTMDGQVIRMVHKVEFSMLANGRPELTITVWPRYVELNLPGSVLALKVEDDEEDDDR